MKKIETIETEIQLLQPKLSIGAHDFNKEEKEALSKSYFEITKMSTGKGRMLDKGCDSCVKNAANIVKNYLQLLPVEDVSIENLWKEEEEKEEPTGFQPSNIDWRRNQASIQEAAEELGLEFPEGCDKKKDRIAFVEQNIEELNKQ